MSVRGSEVCAVCDYSMPLPQQIPVRYTEEDAGYVSVRPVVKQVFRLHELADLVVSIAGKDRRACAADFPERHRGLPRLPLLVGWHCR